MKTYIHSTLFEGIGKEVAKKPNLRAKGQQFDSRRDLAKELTSKSKPHFLSAKKQIANIPD